MSIDPALRRGAPAGLTTPEAPVPNRRSRGVLRDWGGVTAVAAGASVGVAELGQDVYDRAPGAFDTGVRAWALAHRTPGLLAAFEWITRLGAPAVVAALAVVAAVWLWRAHARHSAAVVVAAPLLAVVVFNVIKQLVHRARPDGRLLLHAVTFSFPSGHAAVSAAVFGTLAWVLAREGKLSWAAAVSLAIVCPLLIGLSRVYLNVHWGTDVLAGWCVGVAVTALLGGIYEWDRRRRARTAHVRTARARTA